MQFLKLERGKMGSEAVLTLSYDEIRSLSNALFVLFELPEEAITEASAGSVIFDDSLIHVKEQVDLFASLLKHGNVPDFELKSIMNDATKRKNFDYAEDTTCVNGEI